MVSRRTLLKLGTAGVAAAAAQAPAHALTSALLGDPARISRAIFDARFPESQAFAEALAARGLPVSGIRGDVAALWYGDLKGLLIERRLPLVGLTDRAALFCLEELARDVGMKVRGRIDHTIASNGAASHRATGPSAWAGAGRRLGPYPGFGPVMAAILSEPTLHGASPAAPKHTGPFSAPNQTQLVSWWIA